MFVLEKNLDLSYKQVNFKIDKNTIVDFEMMAQARRLRRAQVHAIKTRLLNAEHFDSPIIISQYNGKKRIIDGQHRITAIREIIQECPEFRVSVLLIMYEDLTLEQEKEIFTRWNSGSRQTAEDIITMYADDMPVFKPLIESGKVSVYGEEGKIKYKQAVTPYILSRVKRSENLDIMGIADFITYAKKLESEDADSISGFIDNFEENTGKIGPHNRWMRACSFLVVAYLYYNREESIEEFWENWEKTKKDREIEKLARTGGIAAQRMILERAKFLMYGIEPIKKEEVEKKFRAKAWDKKAIEHLKEISKTMDKREALEEMRRYMEQPISLAAFMVRCQKLKIKFVNKFLIENRIDPIDKELILKHKDLKYYEIRDKFIEAGRKAPESRIIKAVIEGAA